MRRLLTPAFSARRMRALRVRVTELVDTLLDQLAEQSPPADLHEALSFPLPALVICELLGVPYADRDQFPAWSAGMVTLTDREASAVALAQLVSDMHHLMARKRAHPGEDVISDLLAAHDDEHFRDDQIAELAAALLFAGHETTVTRIDYGTLLLLTHPEQRAALRRDPELVAGAVEEILRVAAPSGGGGGLPRYAHDDIDIAGVTIRAGDAVLLSGVAANRDPTAFADHGCWPPRRPRAERPTAGGDAPPGAGRSAATGLAATVNPGCHRGARGAGSAAADRAPARMPNTGPPTIGTSWPSSVATAASASATSSPGAMRGSQ
ncbi:MAG: cytochrome P450 [Pseudonocardiaceae bacterium]